MTRTSLSYSAVCTAAISSRCNSWDRALRFSGRLSVMRSTFPIRSVRIVSYCCARSVIGFPSSLMSRWSPPPTGDRDGARPSAEPAGSLVDHHAVTHARREHRLVVGDPPHADGQRVAWQHGRREAPFNVAEPSDVVVAQLGEERPTGEAVGAQAVEDRAVEAPERGERRI